MSFHLDIGQALLDGLVMLVAVKTDIDWIKSILKEHGKRINKLEMISNETV